MGISLGCEGNRLVVWRIGDPLIAHIIKLPILAQWLEKRRWLPLAALKSIVTKFTLPLSKGHESQWLRHTLRAVKIRLVLTIAIVRSTLDDIIRILHLLHLVDLKLNNFKSLPHMAYISDR